MTDDSTGIDRAALTTAGLEMMTLGYQMVVSGGPKGNNPNVLGRGWQKVHATANEFMRAVEQQRVTGIGAVTTGLAVIDLDVKPGVDGIANFFEWVDCNDPEFRHVLDVAPCVRTPSGGLHYHLADPTREVNNSGGLLAPLPGVDVRGRGGFIAMPPTQRVETDGYRWIRDPKPVSELAPAPDWMKGRVSGLTGEQVSGSTDWEFRNTEWGTDRLADMAYTVSQTPEGRRNNALHLAARSAGHLIAEGNLTYEADLEVLLLGATGAGLSEPEAIQTINSGVRYVAQKRGEALINLVEGMRDE